MKRNLTMTVPACSKLCAYIYMLQKEREKKIKLTNNTYVTKKIHDTYWNLEHNLYLFPRKVCT